MCKSRIIAKVRKNLGVDKLNLSMNLERLELGSLDYKHMKSLIPNMDCENNHAGNESESLKNRGKSGCKEYIVKINA